MPELTMRAGSAIITPSMPGELAGYAARQGAISEGTHDDLEAALLVLDDGTTQVAWLSLDAIGATQELVTELRTAITGHLRCDAVMVCASHSHSAPSAWAGAPDEPAAAELIAAVGLLASEVAARPAVPVTAEWSQAEVVGVGTNRHDPAGPHDRSIGVLTLRDRGPIALMADFATHPTVLGPDNLRWSADWPGALRRRLREIAPVVLFTQGAAGDVSARFTRLGATFDEVERLGAIAAEASQQGESHTLAPRLRLASAVVPVDRRALPDPADAEVAVQSAAEAVDALGGDPQDPAVRLAQSRLDGARVQRDLAIDRQSGPVQLPIDVVALGDIAWVYLPVEPFASVGHRITELSAYPVTRVIGYSNGYLGYLADAPAHADGTYEALSSTFVPEAAEQVVAAAVELLASIHADLETTR